MISLILSIIFTVLLFVCFKEFEKREINTHQAITINYITASLLAYIINYNDINIIGLISSNWIDDNNEYLTNEFYFLFSSIFLGIFFVIMFNIMAITTQRLGISIASLSSKISLIIPVLTSILIYENTKFYFINGLGIILAMISVYLTLKKDVKPSYPITIAIILFFGAGILDTSLDFIQYNFLKSNSDNFNFIVILFFSAFIAGFLKIIFGHHKIQLKNIYSGIMLGIPNYLSIYFVLEALNQLGGITVFPVLNIGVVLISAIISFIYYKEKINFINWIGISLVCISIFLILYKYDV